MAIENDLTVEASAEHYANGRAQVALAAYAALYERDPWSSRLARMKAALSAADAFDANGKTRVRK
jgi:hypothetical protein